MHLTSPMYMYQVQDICILEHTCTLYIVVHKLYSSQWKGTLLRITCTGVNLLFVLSLLNTTVTTGFHSPCTVFFINFVLVSGRDTAQNYWGKLTLCLVPLEHNNHY